MTDKHTTPDKAALERHLAAFGQQHLLTFWDQLSGTQQQALARQIEQIDFSLIRQLHEGQTDQPDWSALAARAQAPPAIRLQDDQPPFSPQQAVEAAEQALRDGRLGVILVAGGQGTRLGFPHPKGMFAIGPVSGRTLYQMHLEQLLAVRRCYGVAIPLYLMTSPATHEETRRFLAEHDYFGMPPSDVHLFCQGTMPAVDRQGKLLLAQPGQIFVSPDGHGGMLAAFDRSGCLRDAQRRGLQHLYYFQVDNPLVSICDRQLVGYHLLANSELTTQVVAKSHPHDRVGNVVLVDDRMMVIEYSDLPDQAAEQRDSNGRLKLWAGSIAVHVMQLDFLARMQQRADVLPFHRAHKKVAYIDSQGQQKEPTEPNAVKFERFIFDLLPEARNAIVVEADPQQAFAPLKNASGAEKDTPETVRAALIGQHTRWLQQAGATVDPAVDVEISPLFALDAKELAQRIEPGMRVTKPTYFSPPTTD